MLIRDDSTDSKNNQPVLTPPQEVVMPVLLTVPIAYTIQATMTRKDHNQMSTSQNENNANAQTLVLLFYAEAYITALKRCNRYVGPVSTALKLCRNNVAAYRAFDPPLFYLSPSYKPLSSFSTLFSYRYRDPLLCTRPDFRLRQKICR